MPSPSRPWVMTQNWHELLFAHWPLPPAALAPLLPAGLAPDTFDGRAWLGVVPFRMTNVRLRGTPPLPGLSAFPELNVRTYVRLGEHACVWFFSLDAVSRLAVAVARAWFALPYYRARMRLEHEGDDVHYTSTRTHRDAPPAALEVRYAPTGPVQRATPGSLAHFLTERYALLTTDRKGRLRRADVQHAPWPLQPARASFTTNSMTTGLGLQLPDDEPLLHYAERLDVVVGTPRHV